MVAKPYNAFTLADVEMTLLERPLFYIGDHYVTMLGLIAFAGFFAAGLLIARFLQSQIVRRFFSRFKIDANFIAIVTTTLSLAAIVFFTVTAVNAAGIPLAWNAALPAIKLSLVQIFLLVALLIGVFWISSRTKRFLFNRLLAQSGLDRSLQYAIAQVVSNIVLVVGIFIVLENTGIHLAALAVFAGAVGVGLGFGLQNIASNFISGLVILAERPITIGDPRRSGRHCGPGGAHSSAQHSHPHQRQHHDDRAEYEVHRFARDQLDLRRPPCAFPHSRKCCLWQRHRESEGHVTGRRRRKSAYSQGTITGRVSRKFWRERDRL
jgi:small-conductance mechanosensitive channel